MTPRARIASALIILTLTSLTMGGLYLARAPRLAIVGVAIGASSILLGRIIEELRQRA